MSLYGVVIDGLINEDRVLEERQWWGENRSTKGEKKPPVQVPLLPPQIPQALAEIELESPL